MSRVWILQANPNQYDIDTALTVLSQIAWRVPQHTGEIHSGDIALLWRSGSDAGVVGIGRVVGEPEEREMAVDERLYARGSGDEAGRVTRAPVVVRAVPFVAKAEVRNLTGMAEHAIITGPMGTVFAVSPDQWDQLQRLVPAPPDAEALDEGTDLPPIFAWPERLKSVMPMPGGYDGYLGALGRACELVEAERPTAEEFVRVLEREFGLANRGAYLRAIFLRRAGFVVEQNGVCCLSDWARRWLAGRDPGIAIALLHGRTRFVGEMLLVAREPRTVEEILLIANERYGAGWATSTQVNNRRGWLQSAAMLENDDAGRLVTTERGRAFLGRVAIFEPREASSQETALAVDETELPVGLEPPGLPPMAPGVEALIEELAAAATASMDPDRFERAVRDAFEFLGFNAQWLGGSGRTDVLLTATLGRDRSYRVVIDGKTSGSASVGDQQVDWVTLQEHKVRHEADYVGLVAPSPRGSRLFTRAAQQSVSVISVERLSSLCRQHASAPLGLDVYRELFTVGGELDLQPIAEHADEWLRLSGLTRATLRAVRDRSPQFGGLSARDLFLILSDQPEGEGTNEAELSELLRTLAHPLVGLLAGTAEGRYVITSSAEVYRLRLRLLADRVGAAE
ncbi:MAG: EVE domain-containing protein [Acidimicrobiales bacterium]